MDHLVFRLKADLQLKKKEKQSRELSYQNDNFLSTQNLSEEKKKKK